MPLGFLEGQVLKDNITQLNRMAEDAGRGPITIRIDGVPPDPKIIESYEKDGVAGIMFMIPPARLMKYCPF